MRKILHLQWEKDDSPNEDSIFVPLTPVTQEMKLITESKFWRRKIMEEYNTMEEYNVSSS